MIGHEEPRTLLISLSDGSALTVENKPTEVDLTGAEKLVERYSLNPVEVMARDYETDEEIGAAYFKLARSVFLKDGYHVPLLFLFRDRKLVHLPYPLTAENTQQKYLLMRTLAHEVVKHGADAAIMIDESWFARPSDLSPYQLPRDAENRREALVLSLVSMTGEPVQFLAEIERDGDTVSLGETSMSRGGAHFAFAPFYKVWDRPIPEFWLELERSASRRDANTPRR